MITAAQIRQLLADRKELFNRWSEPYGLDNWTRGYIAGHLTATEYFAAHIDHSLLHDVDTLRAHVAALPDRGEPTQ